jgi:hypothetical protein
VIYVSVYPEQEQAFFTVGPDGETFVVEAEIFPGQGGGKEDHAQEAEKKERHVTGEGPLTKRSIPL